MANNSGKSYPGSGDLLDHDIKNHGGDELRAAREAADIDIPTMSSELRIPKNYLTALEEEAYDELPGATYGFGYIRSYCKFLGIEAQPFLDTYKMRVASLQSAQQYHFPDEVLEPKMSGAMTAMLVVLVLLSGYIGWQVLDRYDMNPLTREPAITVANNEQPAVSPSVVEIEVASAATQEPETSEDADESAADIAESAVEETTAPVPLTEAPEAETVVEEVVQAQPETEDESAVAQTQAAQEESAPVVTNEATAQANVRKPAEEIIVKATAAAWVEVVSESGDVIMSKLFQAGENYIAPADQKYYLSTGNAGGLVLAIPGLDEFQAGKVGEIIRDLPLSRDSLRSRRSAISQ